MTYRLVLTRKLGKRTSDEKIDKQITYLLKRSLASSRGKNWTCNTEHRTPYQDAEQNWIFTCICTFSKIKGQKGGEAEYKQWEQIKAMLYQTGQNAQFGDYPWRVLDEETLGNKAAVNIQNAATQVPTESLSDMIGDINKSIIELSGVKTVQANTNIIKTWKDLEIPPELLGPNSDRELANHPAWRNLYGLGPQIRILLSNIKRAKETNGRVRNHSVLFGHAGCGKTTTLLALEKMFGQGFVLRLDATSTTRPGLEKLFFQDLLFIPPFVFMEEAEKADVEALKIWLGVLDERGELRKINFRVNQLREMEILFFCTVNDKRAFDRMMGSDGTEAGALSSRCVSQLYFPRPTDVILQQILRKEIEIHGGNMDWIVPSVQLARELNVSDPRIVRSFLAGGDRLLDGTYQQDWLLVKEAKENFQK